MSLDFTLIVDSLKLDLAVTVNYNNKFCSSHKLYYQNIPCRTKKKSMKILLFESMHVIPVET